MSELILSASEIMIKQLERFQLNKVINTLGDGTVVALGLFADDLSSETRHVIVKMGPLPINLPDDETFPDVLRAIRMELKTESGSRFMNFNGFGNDSVKYAIEIIFPATDADIKRNTRIQMHIIQETPYMFQIIVQPTTLDTKNIEWVYNILDGHKETDRVLLNDNDPQSGFMLMIDTKWRDHPDRATPLELWKGHSSIRNLYCLALVHDRSLRSLRDLRGIHANYLENLLINSLTTIEDTYGICRSEIRAFIHYPPQFYHLHIHFTRVGNEFGCPVEKAHMLSDVIDLLRIDGQIFTKRTITCRIGENEKLFPALRDAQIRREASYGEKKEEIDDMDISVSKATY